MRGNTSRDEKHIVARRTEVQPSGKERRGGGGQIGGGAAGEGAWGTREETVRGESNKRQGKNLKMITGESWVE